MTPLQQYQADLAAGRIYGDPGQEHIVSILQRIYDQLISSQDKLWYRLAHKLVRKKPKLVKGLYVWGSVGTGKTYLMDLFYNSLPIKRKLRMHFHSFMAEVHRLLVRLQGQPEPLQIIARYFSSKAHVLCFDEFIVNDIGDAMLLGNLLQALFKRGVCLIVTSNVAPGDLYKDGLQRAAFLPTIALLQQNTQVEYIQSRQDYRLRNLVQAGLYFTPLDDKAEAHLSTWFNYYAPEPSLIFDEPLIVLGRAISVVKRAETVVWFRFQEICTIPRSQNDYLEIVKQYSAILVSDIPQFSEQEDNAVRYLINLVDICYDCQVKLILSAAVPIKELYKKGRLYFEFQRTCSRLQEMQSQQYLNNPHKKL